ncbi:uncharacterized protein LOC135138277 [Zophobas morio]|uniref:uncharacterized protein LOC135138277 n=1 Tax=Zophobas morio TaxID=2755281 RepID=UPI0030838095
MCSRVAVLFFVLCLENIDCVTQLDIRSQFQPTLLRLQDLANVKYVQTDNECKFLVTHLKKYQTRVKLSSRIQIRNIRKAVAAARKLSPKGDTCLKEQEVAVSRLNTDSFDNCFSKRNISDLYASTAKFKILKRTAASSTLHHCRYLSNLPDTQLKPYTKCLSNQVSKLSLEVSLAESGYRKLKNATLHDGIQCLVDSSGDILGQIWAISYQIGKCGCRRL